MGYNNQKQFKFLKSEVTLISTNRLFIRVRHGTIAHISQRCNAIPMNADFINNSCNQLPRIAEGQLVTVKRVCNQLERLGHHSSSAIQVVKHPNG